MRTDAPTRTQSPWNKASACASTTAIPNFSCSSIVHVHTMCTAPTGIADLTIPKSANAATAKRKTSSCQAILKCPSRRGKASFSPPLSLHATPNLCNLSLREKSSITTRATLSTTVWSMLLTNSANNLVERNTSWQAILGSKPVLATPSSLCLVSRSPSVKRSSLRNTWTPLPKPSTTSWTARKSPCNSTRWNSPTPCSGQCGACSNTPSSWDVSNASLAMATSSTA